MTNFTRDREKRRETGNMVKVTRLEEQREREMENYDGKKDREKREVYGGRY